MGRADEAIESAWDRVAYDCGCPDLYYCPNSNDVECPRHSGFDVCCDGVEQHVPVRPDLRTARPRPPIPSEELDEG